MKKIIFIIAGALIAVVGYSQSNASSPAIKRMTVEEANKLTGVAQPTINGIPYSQYKAQQDALLKQPAAIQQPVNNNGNGTPVKPGTTKPTVKPVEDIRVKAQPERTAEIVVDNVSKTNSTPAQTVVPTPAIQTIPAGTLKSSPVTAIPVPDVTSASKTNAGTITSGGPLVPMPLVNVALANGNTEAKQATTTPANNTVQQVITEAKPAAVQETQKTKN